MLQGKQNGSKHAEKKMMCSSGCMDKPDLASCVASFRNRTALVMSHIDEA